MTAITTTARRPDLWARVRVPFEQRAVAYTVTGLLVLAVSGISVLLRRRVPSSQLNISDVDGLLYARDARALLSGQWLGTYSSVTLAKVPGYPLFLAASFRLGIPAKLAEQAVALLAALMVAACVLLATRRLSWALVAYTFLAFDPLFFSTQSADLLRDSLFASLGVLMLACLFLTTHVLALHRGYLFAMAAAVPTGLVVAFYVLMREEGSAFLPTAAAAMAAGPALRWFRGRSDARDPLGRRFVRAASRALPCTLVLGVATALPIMAVQHVNDSHYGLAVTNDWMEGAFSDAYGQWERVIAGPPASRVPITAHQREAVYAVSATARRLAPFLESPAAHGSNCRIPPDCDYLGGWMPWAIRAAAAQAGVYTSAPHAQAFFARLASDINDACADGRLSCRRMLPASLQALSGMRPADFLDSGLRLTGELWTARNTYDQATSVLPVPDELRSEISEISPSIPATDAAAVDQQASFDQHRAPFRALAALYTLLVPIASGLGAVLLLVIVATRRGRERVGPLTALAGALLVGVIFRVALIAIIDAAEFDTDPRYLFPAHTLLLAFTAVSIAEGLRVVDLSRLGRLVR